MARSREIDNGVHRKRQPVIATRFVGPGGYRRTVPRQQHDPLPRREITRVERADDPLREHIDSTRCRSVSAEGRRCMLSIGRRHEGWFHIAQVSYRRGPHLERERFAWAQEGEAATIVVVDPLRSDVPPWSLTCP